MGRGDKKTKKGKVWKDSYGNSRKRSDIKLRLKRRAAAKLTAETPAPAKPKKAPTRKKSDS